MVTDEPQIDRLNMLRLLGEDHGGEGEAAPNQESIDAAISFIRKWGLPANVISTVDDDGMAVLELHGDSYAEITFRASPALAPVQAEGWRSMESAPKDTPILGWCVHDADPYHNPVTGRLTDYGCSAEGLGRVQDGPHVLVWGGGDSDYDEWSGRYIVWPDWWFRLGSDFEQAANPTHWMPISAPPATSKGADDVPADDPQRIYRTERYDGID